MPRGQPTPPASRHCDAPPSRPASRPGEGFNDRKCQSHGVPCPPIGVHRYVHKLYALDTVLPVPRPATKAALEKAMQGHILAKGELVGYYKKKK
ncbi:MAG: hypothetical protein K0M66_07870 [Thiobacillus sp.]|nr:hypothetical protein [Thiobacillus sp.]